MTYCKRFDNELSKRLLYVICIVCFGRDIHYLRYVFRENFRSIVENLFICNENGNVKKILEMSGNLIIFFSHR